MITFSQVDKTHFSRYDEIPMLVHIKSQYQIEKINNGLGGFLLKEIPVDEYTKSFNEYEIASDYEKQWDISNWAIFMAFDDDKSIAGATVVTRTKDIDMLSGRDDLAVLWNIRVADEYKHQGIGQQLFNMASLWSKEHNMRQMKIECQNNNIPACKFYHKQGAVLCEINEYAYYNDSKISDEVQFIWYLDL